MKNILVILFVFGLISCEKNFETASLNVDVNLKEISSKINKSSYLTGYGTLLTNSNHEIILGFDETNDGAYERLIIVQSEVEKTFAIPTAKSELLWLKNEALLKVSETGELFYFSTPENKEKSKIISLLPSSSEISVENFITGFGFVLMNGIWKSDQINSKKSFFRSENGKTQEFCHAGGCGSTECSTFVGGSGCSTTCSEGYYACCSSPLDCHCTKINSNNCPEEDQ